MVCVCVCVCVCVRVRACKGDRFRFGDGGMEGRSRSRGRGSGRTLPVRARPPLPFFSLSRSCSAMTTEPASTTAPSAAAPPAKKLYTLADLKAHASEAACWVLIHGKVYDVTPFLDEHPGGFDIILSSTGALLVVFFFAGWRGCGGRDVGAPALGPGVLWRSVGRARARFGLPPLERHFVQRRADGRAPPRCTHAPTTHPRALTLAPRGDKGGQTLAWCGGVSSPARGRVSKKQKEAPLLFFFSARRRAAAPPPFFVAQRGRGAAPRRLTCGSPSARGCVCPAQRCCLWPAQIQARASGGLLPPPPADSFFRRA